jgi:hypothetical protein
MAWVGKDVKRRKTQFQAALPNLNRDIGSDSGWFSKRQRERSRHRQIT